MGGRNLAGAPPSPYRRSAPEPCLALPADRAPCRTGEIDVTCKRTVAIAVAGLALLAPADALGVGVVHDATPPPSSRDLRSGAVAPAAAQRAAVRKLGATAELEPLRHPALAVCAAAAGSPRASRAPRPAPRARSCGARLPLFRLSAADVAALELVNDSRLTGSDAHVVLFRQRFGGLPAAANGMAGRRHHPRPRRPTRRRRSAPRGALRGRAPADRPGRLDAARRAASACGRGASPCAAAATASASSRCAGLPAAAAGSRGRRAHPRRRRPARVRGQRRRHRRARRRPTPSSSTRSRAPCCSASTGSPALPTSRAGSTSPTTPPLDGADDDRRIIGCFPDAAFSAACANGGDFDERTTAPASGPDAGPVPWDEGGAGVNTTSGNNADTGLSAVEPADAGRGPAASGRSQRHPRVRRRRSPTPGADSACDPSELRRRHAARQRPRRHRRQRHQRRHHLAVLQPQPDARLGLRPRLHREELQPPGLQLRQAAGPEGDPELGNAQAGALAGGVPELHRARQRQPDHAPGRHPADHEHVPVAADRAARSTRPAPTATSTCR